MIETRECKWCYVVGTEAVYPFPVRFLAAEDVRCYLAQDGEERELTAGTEFAVEVKADYSTGANITLLLDPLPEGAVLAILRDTPVKQLLSLPEFGKLPAVGLETSLDKLTMIVQELSEVAGRCIKVPVTEETDPEEVYQAAQAAPEFAAKAEEFATEAAQAVIQIRQMMDNPYQVRSGFGDKNPGYLVDKIVLNESWGGLADVAYNPETEKLEIMLTAQDGVLTIENGVLTVVPSVNSELQIDPTLSNLLETGLDETSGATVLKLNSSIPTTGTLAVMIDSGSAEPVETGTCAAESLIYEA